MMSVDELYKRARLRFGEKSQIIKCIEEMSELQKCLCKLLLNDKESGLIGDIAEEIADVEIMIEQLKIFFGPDLIDQRKIKKLIRLEERLK